MWQDNLALNYPVVFSKNLKGSYNQQADVSGHFIFSPPGRNSAFELLSSLYKYSKKSILTLGFHQYEIVESIKTNSAPDIQIANDILQFFHSVGKKAILYWVVERFQIF